MGKTFYAERASIDEIVLLTRSDAYDRAHGKAIQHLARLPEKDQDRVAQRVLEISELTRAEEAVPQPLASFLGVGGGQTFTSVQAVDAYVRDLRDEWES